MRKSIFVKMLLLLLSSVLFVGMLSVDSVAATSKPSKVKIKSVSSSSAKKVKVKWRKVSKVSKYQVQIAKNKKFTMKKQTKTISAKKSSYTFSKLQSNTKYYVRVRAYKVVKGKKYYGKWSSIKSVRTKSNTTQDDKTDDKTNDKTNDEKEEDNRKDISSMDLKFVLKYETHAYTGEALKPTVRLYNNNVYLVKDVDYTVEYTNNINAGKATVTVTGKEKYKGTLTKNFEITKIYQSFSIDMQNNMYVGKTQKLDLSGLFGHVEFTTSDEGIVEISNDGTITAKKSGTTLVYITVSGDDNHYPLVDRYLGRIDVVNEQASATGFNINAWSNKDTYKVSALNSRNADGSNTYKVNFMCDADEKWIDENVEFIVEDVTPAAYKNMFTNMGVEYVAPSFTITSAESVINTSKQYGYQMKVHEKFTENGPGKYDTYATAGKVLKVEAGASVRVVKITAKKNDEILDYIYVGSNGLDGDNKQSEYDVALYQQVRQRVEAKLWTEDMTNLDKLCAIESYINGTTHYPGTETTDKDTNPEFWANWAVDDTELFYSMFNDVKLNRIMDFQGGVVTCVAADILITVATEDMGLKYLYDSENDVVLAGEGVWLTSGSYSSNPSNPYHYSVKYKYADETSVFLDAQGMSNGSCNEHNCQSKIISLQ